MDNYNYNNDSDSIFLNIKSIINYVIENHDKFVLLLFVFIIIYFVDYITYINGMLYGATSPPGLPSLKTSVTHLQHIKNPKRKGKDKRV
jgi:hypothetical protein